MESVVKKGMVGRICRKRSLRYLQWLEYDAGMWLWVCGVVVWTCRLMCLSGHQIRWFSGWRQFSWKTTPPCSHHLTSPALGCFSSTLHWWRFISLHFFTLHRYLLPSVPRRCWLRGRKSIQPVKIWLVGCWHGCLSGARCRLAYGPADATATDCLLLR